MLERIPVFLAIVTIGCALVGIRVLIDRNERVRLLARRMYEDDGYLMYLRAMPWVAPILGVACLLVSPSALVPRPWSGWCAIPGMTVGAVGLLLSYRSTMPLLPRWMRDEIDAGTLAPAKPDLIDWIWYVVAAPILVLGPVALVLLLVNGVPAQP